MRDYVTKLLSCIVITEKLLFDSWVINNNAVLRLSDRSPNLLQCSNVNRRHSSCPVRRKPMEYLEWPAALNTKIEETAITASSGHDTCKHECSS